MTKTNKVLSLYIAPTLILFTLITVERTVNTDGAFDKLYGLPLPYISNGYAFSFHYDIYIINLLVDLALYLLFVVIVIKLIELIGLRIRTNRYSAFFGLIISLLLIAIFILYTLESSYKLISDIEYQVIDWKIHTRF